MDYICGMTPSWELVHYSCVLCTPFSVHTFHLASLHGTFPICIKKSHSFFFFKALLNVNITTEQVKWMPTTLNPHHQSKLLYSQIKRADMEVSSQNIGLPLNGVLSHIISQIPSRRVLQNPTVATSKTVLPSVETEVSKHISRAHNWSLS
jgi:hypothetical protein